MACLFPSTLTRVCSPGEQYAVVSTGQRPITPLLLCPAKPLFTQKLTIDSRESFGSAGVMSRNLPTFHQLYISVPLTLPSGPRNLWSETGQKDSPVLGHTTTGLVEDSSHSFDSVTPAPPRVAGPVEDRPQARAQVYTHSSKGGESPN